MFQHSISSEELAKKEKFQKISKFSSHHNSFEKNIWLWVGVGIIMSVLFFFWAQTLPSQIQTRSADEESRNFFEKSKKSLAVIFNTEKNQVDQLKEAIAAAFSQSASTATSSLTTKNILASSTLNLSDKQIEEIKNKILNKKK